MEQFSRSSLIYTKEGIEILQKKKIAIMGLGGVGSYVFEALIRTGVREFYLYDADTIDITNCNRQLFALHSTLMKPKVDVAKMRGEDINPNVIIHTQRIFIDQTSIQSLPFQEFDYIIDAIDTVSSKILLIEYAKKYNVPIICSMGTGNKIDPFAFQITDISKTSVCPLARVMRQVLKKRNISNVVVLWSKENPIKPNYTVAQKEENQNKLPPGSTSFIPGIAGLTIAGYVINDLIKKEIPR